jgi:hypothetical protein
MQNWEEENSPSNENNVKCRTAVRAVLSGYGLEKLRQSLRQPNSSNAVITAVVWKALASMEETEQETGVSFMVGGRNRFPKCPENIWASLPLPGVCTISNASILSEDGVQLAVDKVWGETTRLASPDHWTGTYAWIANSMKENLRIRMVQKNIILFVANWSKQNFSECSFVKGNKAVMMLYAREPVQTLKQCKLIITKGLGKDFICNFYGTVGENKVFLETLERINA